MTTLPAHEAITLKNQLLKERRELEAKIAAYNSDNSGRERVSSLEASVAVLTQEVKDLTAVYETEKNNPFNYYCYFTSEKLGDRWRMEHRTGNRAMYLFMSDKAVNDAQLFKIGSTDESDYYVLSAKDLGDKPVVIFSDTLGDGNGYLILDNCSVTNWNKIRFNAVGNGFYTMTIKARENTHYVQLRVGSTDGTHIVEALPNLLNHRFKLQKTDMTANERINNMVRDLQGKINQLNVQVKELEELKATLTAAPTEKAEKAKWEQRLQAVNDKLANIKIESTHRFNPYVEKKKGEVIFANDWNDMQVQIRQAIAQHSHNDADSMQITAEAIADNAVEERHISPNSNALFNKLTVNNGVTVTGDLTVSSNHIQLPDAVFVQKQSRHKNKVYQVISNKQQPLSNHVYETIPGLELTLTPVLDGYAMVRLKLSGIQKDNMTETNYIRFVLKQDADIIDHTTVNFHVQGWTYLSVQLSALVPIVKNKPVTIRAQYRVNEAQRKVWVNRANSWSHLTVMELSNTHYDSSKPPAGFASDVTY